MPVAIGFHPYPQLTDSVRDVWTLSVPAKYSLALLPTKDANRRDPADRVALSRSELCRC